MEKLEDNSIKHDRTISSSQCRTLAPSTLRTYENSNQEVEGVDDSFNS